MKKEIKKYIPWIILILIILSLSLWYILSKRITQEQMSVYESKVQEAQTHYEAKQYTMALTKYYEAVDEVPSKIEAYEGILEILLEKNKLEDALEIVDKSSKPLASKDRSQLYMKIGDVYYASGNYEKAYSIYQDGQILGVTNLPLEMRIAKVQLNLGKVDEAKGQLVKSGYKDELLEETTLLLSYIYVLEDKDKAKNTIASLVPSEGMVAYYDEFKEVLESLDDDEKFNAAKLARVYINNGYPYLAIQVLEPIEDDIVEYLEGMYFLGKAYYEYGMYEQAVQALDSALTLGGFEKDIFWTKARSYIQLGDIDNASNSYQGALGYSSEELDVGLIREYIELLKSNNQLVQANDVIKDQLSTHPEEPILYILASDINLLLEESEKVGYYLGQLSEMDLDQETQKEYLHKKLEYLSWNNENLVDTLSKLEEIDQFDPYYHYYLAKKYVSEDQKDFAIQSLEKALEYDLEYNITQESLILLSSLR